MEGDYKLVITHPGYTDFKKIIFVTATEKIIDPGSILVEEDYKTLQDLVVAGESPIQVKNDPGKKDTLARLKPDMASYYIEGVNKSAVTFFLQTWWRQAMSLK